jgi:hypothetical protein
MHQGDTQLAAWRLYLATLIEVPAERQRAAATLGISEYTLTRWATSEIEPRPGSLKRLPGVFPGHEQRLTELIREVYDPSRAIPGDLMLKEIPSAFCTRVLATLARTAGPIVASSICNLVLRQAIEHFDPDLLGVEITVAQCTPFTAGFCVRSLFERMAAATPPWTKGIGKRLLFLGAESLCGYVVGTGEPGIIQDLEQEHELLPTRSSAYEKSAVAYPLLRRGRIAGCFLVSSTQRGFFTPERIDLVEQYANLIALAYLDEQFYRPKEIRLEVMPSSSVQQRYTASFRRRVLERRKTSHQGETEAELCVVQEIERALLQEPVCSQESEESTSMQRN